MSSLNFISSIVDKISKGEQDVEIYMSERSLWIIPSMNPDTYDANIRSAHVVNKKRKAGKTVYGMHRKSQHPVCDAKNKRLYVHSL